MAVLTADDLLLGPRGRLLCMAVAHRLNEDVWSRWLNAAWHPGDASRRDELLRALDHVDAGPVFDWPDPLMFLEPVDETITSAMYWQPPDDQDVAAADPTVVEALRPVADAVAGAAGTAWWSTPLDLTTVRYTSRFDDEAPVPPAVTGAREQLERWRIATLADERDAFAHRPADPAASFSGHWWSTPALTSLVSTTRALPGLGSVKLVWEEDGFGQVDAAIWPLRVRGEPRVWEIDGPGAWTLLVDRYPLDVSNARRHDWYQATGRVGAWRIPDWSAVAADWDGVHLTVAGYLSTATRALPLADAAAATVLAGWDPDQTWWLTDILEATTSRPQMWHNDAGPNGPGFAWRRATV